MNERMPPGPGSVEREEKKGKEEISPKLKELRAWFARKGWLDEKDPKPELAPEDRREARLLIEILEGEFMHFEATYPLEALHAITDLAPKDAPFHPIRQPAKIALEPIVDMLNRLFEETNVSPEKYKELQAQYRRLSLAVGFIVNNKVRHD